jgi:hypothetical protein
LTARYLLMTVSITIKIKSGPILPELSRTSGHSVRYPSFYLKVDLNKKKNTSRTLTGDLIIAYRSCWRQLKVSRRQVSSLRELLASWLRFEIDWVTRHRTAIVLSNRSSSMSYGTSLSAEIFGCWVKKLCPKEQIGIQSRRG